MNQLLAAKLAGATQIDDLQARLLACISEQRRQGENVALVSGPLALGGLGQNIARLNQYVAEARLTFHGQVFSCADVVYNLGLQEKLDVYGLPEKDRRARIIEFWQAVVQGGITDVFMVPGWEQSEGACDEHTTAVKLGLRIHYL